MSETTWKKEPAIEVKHGGCLNCGPRPSFFPPDGVIGVGFGYAGLHRDGEPVWTGDRMRANILGSSVVGMYQSGLAREGFDTVAVESRLGRGE